MSKKLWNLYAPVYSLAMRADGKTYRKMMERIPEVIRDKDVLEIATGPGTIAKSVACAAKSMIATDYAENMIVQAKKGEVPDNLIFEVADAMDLPYEEDRFDVVLIANALHIVPDPKKVLAEIDRVLKPGGILIAPNFVEHNKDSLWNRLLAIAGVRFEHQWTAEQYREFLETNGWKIVNYEELEARIPLAYTECIRQQEQTSLPVLKQRPDYKNWVPKGMVASFFTGAAVLGLSAVYGGTRKKKTSRMIGSVSAMGAVGMLAAGTWCAYAYNQFSYDGKRKLSKQIVEGTAKYVRLPEGGIGLDVGCGSGALTIACARQNPHARMVGCDRWGKEYASFSLRLCERNAQAEKVDNVSFVSGNAVSLPFEDESFDAVTSNYVYHNITGKNKQELLLETLRVLKKGGTFAIHDIMSPARYGDMQAFRKKLLDMGYETVELIDTSNLFMNRKEALLLDLKGSTLLTGKK